MNGGGVSTRIGVEGASNGINDVVAQAIAQVADRASSSPETESGANKGPCPAFLKFLECDVAVDQLMKFLKVEEMKVLCLVSKDMLAAVTGTTEFAKRSLFDIKKELDASEVDLHNRFPFSWKHMAFDVSLPMEVVNQFGDKLKGVESLQLYYKARHPYIPVFESDELSPSSVVECCIRIHVILSMAVNLRKLEMDLLFLQYPLNETLSNWEVQQSMSKLESLIVYGMDVGRVHSAQFQQNLLQLSRCPLNKIKKLCIQYSCWSEELHCMAEIVKAFKETLEVLDLNQSIWSLEEMRAIQFPKLRQLTLDMSERDLEDVAAFVEKQPVLEELYLDVHTEDPANDLKCLQGRLSNLRKFRYFVDQECLYDTDLMEVDWSFLGTMTKLEESTVKLHLHGRGPEMIDRLPDSVQKLSVSCNLYDADFWSSCRQLEGFSPNVGDRLKGLKNLTHLTFDGCSGAVTNVGLQTIIKNFPELMQLKLKYCLDLTEFGINGMNGDDGDGVEELQRGVPLSDLKGLVELEISHCESITTACVLTVVRFKGLRRFTFDTSDANAIQDTVHFAAQIQKENPRLAFLQHNRHTWIKNGLVWTHSDDDDEED